MGRKKAPTGPKLSPKELILKEKYEQLRERKKRAKEKKDQKDPLAKDRLEQAKKILRVCVPPHNF